MLNPATPKWTGAWHCITYASDTDLLLKIDEDSPIGTARGETWVGELIPYPNLFRVYRNTISFEKRRASTNEYAEVHTRIIPKKPHSVTNDVDSTKI
jgi:hypothetical protein